MMRSFLALILLLTLCVSGEAQSQRPGDMTTNPGVLGTDIVWCPRGTSADYKCSISAIGAFLATQFNGDCTASALNSIICLKTNGVSFATSATVDATNASNISTGTIGAAFLPLGSSSAFGAVKVDGTSITASGGVITSTTPGIIYHGPIYVATKWYMPFGSYTVAAGTALAQNSIRCHIQNFFKSITVSDLQARVTTLAAGGNVQIALYATNSAGDATGTVLASTGSLSTAATGLVSGSVNSGTPKAFGEGVYSACINSDNATNAMTSIGLASPFGSQLYGSATAANILSAAGTTSFFKATAQTFGTWPDLTSATWTEGTSAGFALIAFRVQSVP